MNDNRAPDLLCRLKEYAEKDVCPMHMPGHKRTALGGSELPWQLDITEIDGFDNLHAPEGILADGMQLAAELYGSERAFYLINGSTGGILAGIAAAAPPGSRVLMARGCHKSVYNAVELLGLRAAYLLPPADEVFGVAGSVTPQMVEQALEVHWDARLVILTSPTYEGVVSDIASIARVCHTYGVPLLVDEAHGAHLGFSPAFYGGAVKAGADIVIQSLHKTLPSLTQTALAHLSGDLVDPNEMARRLAMFETSSPSYLLMGSIHRCLCLLQERGEELFSAWAARLQLLDERLQGLRHLRVLCHGADSLRSHRGFWGFDPGKVVVSGRTAGLRGPQLMEMLRTRYGIECEMAMGEYVLAMTSPADSEEAILRLCDALLAIDAECTAAPPAAFPALPELPPQVMPAAQARSVGWRTLSLAEASGRVMAESLWAYPPGVPLAVPGEVCTAALVQAVRALEQAGVRVYSDSGSLPDAVRVR